MSFHLLAYLVAHSLAWITTSYIYKAWVLRPGGYRHKSILGITLAVGCIATLILPFMPWAKQEALHDPGWQNLLNIVFLVAAIAAGLVGLVSIASHARILNSLDSCPTECDPMTSTETFQGFLETRANLASCQGILGKRLGVTVPLCLSEAVMHPLLVGPTPYRIYVPVRLAQENEAMEAVLEPLAMWAGRRRFRIYMALWWISRFCLLLGPLMTGIRRALARELTHEIEEDPFRRGRYLAALQSFDGTHGMDFPMGLAPLGFESPEAPSHAHPWGFIPAVGLVLACGWGAWASGGFNPGNLFQVGSNPQITGYSTHGYDPADRFHPWMGKGGLLPDGLLVDTLKEKGSAGCSTIRFPLGLLDTEKQIPFGAEALKVHLEWKTLARQTWASDPPALKITCAEQTPVDGHGQQRLVVFYSRNVVVPESSYTQGHFDLFIPLHPMRKTLTSSSEVIYGPVIYIPKGWKIAFYNYLVEKASLGQVPPIPVDEAKQFVAWYRRNGRGPALPDLRWELVSKQSTRSKDGG